MIVVYTVCTMYMYILQIFGKVQCQVHVHVCQSLYLGYAVLSNTTHVGATTTSTTTSIFMYNSTL